MMGSISRTGLAKSGSAPQSAAAMLLAARHQSDEALFNTILYPEPELEIGSPAPGFTAAGTLITP